ncbi:MAG: hypothetical protein J6J44_14390 [Lachnospiraceae bacterium]|nr:hypothetical protein [Lachnospiraceae bacterium]MBP3595706.1 hypothetical protein [Lachnospiraceae bacterium]
MELVKVTPEFYELCEKYGANKNRQLLVSEAGRPCVLVVSLVYCGKKRKFVVPMKSNIKSSEDKKNYFALPPNSRTQRGCRHGVFYIKLFPISERYINPYYYSNNTYLCKIKKKIDENEKIIVNACQNYLERYANGKGMNYTPDIDKIIEILDNQNADTEEI